MRPSKLFSRAITNIVQSGAAKLPLLRSKKRPLESMTVRELIQLESEVGRTLFGELASHVTRREFFNLDATTWIWHEEWLDANNVAQQQTTRYEITPEGVMKGQPGLRYQHVEGTELENLRLAAELYHERVMRDIYQRHERLGDKHS